MFIKTLVKPRSNEHRKETDKYYQSREYRLWRKQVIKKSNGMCAMCLNPNLPNQNGVKSKIVRAGKYTDHIRPIKKGGSPDDVNNGQYLCRYHNNAKTARDK